MYCCTALSHRQRVCITVYAIIVVASVFLFVVDRALLRDSETKSQSTCQCDPVDARSNKSIRQQIQTTGSSAETASCEAKLDKIERVWDVRRNARIEKIQRDAIRWKSGSEMNTFDIWEPEAVCFDVERFGGGARYQSWGDGPKFVCGVDRIVEKAQGNHGCLIYSVGSNNQIDFEQSVANVVGPGKCEVHTFDPTMVPGTFVGGKYSQFHDWGFGKDGKETNIAVPGRGNFQFTEVSLETTMKKLGHVGQVIDILKIDCEGCEYEAVKQAFKDIANGKIHVDQVQMEVHLRRAPTKDAIIALFEAADQANMRLFFKEHNHWGCSGYGCVEYAFASNAFLRKANGYYVC